MTKNNQLSSVRDRDCYARIGSHREICRDLSQAVAQSLRICSDEQQLSREQIATRISALVNRVVTKSMLDNWASTSHARHQIPADIIAAFCIVTATDAIAQVFARYMDGIYLTGEEALRFRISQKQKQMDRLQYEIAEMESRLNDDPIYKRRQS